MQPKLNHRPRQYCVMGFDWKGEHFVAAGNYTAILNALYTAEGLTNLSSPSCELFMGTPADRDYGPDEGQGPGGVSRDPEAQAANHRQSFPARLAEFLADIRRSLGFSNRCRDPQRSDH